MLTGSPRVSIIVSAYNAEDYLARCLDSLHAQTLQDIEVLCVDDGSTDATPDILAAAAARDPRVRVLRHEKNSGLGATRNTAIAAARAEYIGAVDADDYVAPDMFANLLAGSAEGFFDVVCCGFARVDAFGTELSRGMNHKARYETMPRDANIFNIVNPSFWNKIWRRSLFVDNRIVFPENYYYEDAATTPIVMLQVKSLNLIGGACYSYVQRPGSIIKSFCERHIIEYLRVLDVVKDELLKRGVYMQYKSMFDRYVISQFEYLCQNIAANPGLSLTEKKDHMRRVMIIAQSYVVHDDVLRQDQAERRATVA